MPSRVNRRAIFAKTEGTSGTKEALTLAEAIPVNDITNTPLEANTVERPLLRGFYGANKSAVANKTQAITIICPLYGNHLGTDAAAKEVLTSPLDPLIRACGHSIIELGGDLGVIDKDTTSNSPSANSVRARLYRPTDTITQTCTITYVLDDIIQTMVGARGTMSFNLSNGEFPTMTFEMRSDFDAPAGGSVTGGDRPTFPVTEIVSGKDTFQVPDLPSQFGNCVHSFSFSQNNTIEVRDCATREGNNKLQYVLTARSSTGELVADVDKSTLAEFYKYAGTEKTLEVPIKEVSNAIRGLAVYGTSPSTKGAFVFGSDSILLGAASEGDLNGLATYTVPLTFSPESEGNDYVFGWTGDLSE